MGNEPNVACDRAQWLAVKNSVAQSCYTVFHLSTTAVSIQLHRALDELRARVMYV